MATLGTGLAPIIEEPPQMRPRWVAAQVLWLKRGALMRVAFRTALISLIVVFLIPKKYEATAQLMPPNQGLDPAVALLANLTSGGNTGVGSLATAASGIASSLLGAGDEGQMLIGVMRSQTVEDKIIGQFGLMDRYWKRYIEDTRVALEDHVDIEEDRKSGIISITVEDKDPEVASKMAHAYVETLNSLLADVNASAAHRERVFIDQRLQQVKQQLDQASVEFSQFSSKNTTIDLPEQGKAMMDAAAMLQGQIIAAQAQLSGLQQIYTPDNFRVKQLQAQIAEMNQQLNKFGGKDISGKLPAASSESLIPSIRALPLLGVKYADLYRTLKIDETVYEMLTQALELAKVEEAREVPSVQVLDPGVVPEKKSFPPRTLLILLTTFLVTCIAGIWVLARQRWSELDSLDDRKALLSDIYAQAQLLPCWRWRFVLWIAKFFRRIDNLLTRLESAMLRWLRLSPAVAGAEE